jgi:hypothetical protein
VTAELRHRLTGIWRKVWLISGRFTVTMFRNLWIWGRGYHRVRLEDKKIVIAEIETVSVETCYTAVMTN